MGIETEEFQETLRRKNSQDLVTEDVKVKGKEGFNFTLLDESENGEPIPQTMKWPVWEKGKIKSLEIDVLPN